MADNITLSAGTADGSVLATDDVGGVHYQIVKLTYGVADSATLVSSSNGLPVAQQGTWNVSTVTTVTTVAAVTAISNALPAGTNNIGDVDVLTLPAIPAGNNNIGDVDIASIAAGNNNIGDVDIASIAAGTNNIGDVDVLTVPADPFGVNADAASATGSISAKLRFIAGTGIPITGNVTVVNGGTFVTQENGSALTALQLIDDTVLADNAQFTDGTTKVNIAGFIFDEVAGTALTENDTAAARIDSKRALVNVIEDATTRGQRMVVTAAGAASTNIAQVAATTTAVNNGTASAGCQRVTIASDNTAFSVNATVKPATSGGLTTHHVVSAGSTNATNVKASAGQLYGWYIYNSNAAARKVAFHNSAGTPTAGASIFFTIVIPPSSAANVFSETGIAFSTGIAYTMVTDLTDAGATAVAASDLVANFWYA